MCVCADVLGAHVWLHVWVWKTKPFHVFEVSAASLPVGEHRHLRDQVSWCVWAPAEDQPSSPRMSRVHRCVCILHSHKTRKAVHVLNQRRSVVEIYRCLPTPSCLWTVCSIATKIPHKIILSCRYSCVWVFLCVELKECCCFSTVVDSVLLITKLTFSGLAFLLI